MTRRRQDVMRWKLELPGTSRTHAQAVEVAVDEIGWRRVGATEILFGPALTRIYVETDPGESAEHVAIELMEHLNVRIPNVTGTKRTTWAAVADQLRRARETRARNARREQVTRPVNPQPLPGFG